METALGNCFTAQTQLHTCLGIHHQHEIRAERARESRVSLKARGRVEVSLPSPDGPLGSTTRVTSGCGGTERSNTGRGSEEGRQLVTRLRRVRVAVRILLW